MAFTGAATVKRISDRIYRITGLSLGGAASGTIGPEGSGANVELPGTSEWKPNGDCDLADMIDYTVKQAAANVLEIPVSVTKAATGVATFTNTTAATAGPALEIYAKYLD